MAKIGTAHVEIKPVLNEEALDAIAERIEARVERAIAGGEAQLTLAEWVHVDKRGLLINGARLPYYLAEEPIEITRDATGMPCKVTVTLLANHASTADDVLDKDVVNITP
ncbi:MAG TPA: hypothetical protein VJ782_01535 [Aeromicrobium sp.]|nr:hypothetical protein [Aeromicrobium sp.]